ncbi:hypothetical protein Droror1_Dr00017283 [Drosera rotundifolia]
MSVSLATEARDEFWYVISKPTEVSIIAPWLQHQSEYNYGDFIPVLRLFLRGYLKICKEVKERRLQLFKDYFVDEHKKLSSTRESTNNELKCAIDHILE